MEYTVDIEIRNENEEPIPYFIFDSQLGRICNLPQLYGGFVTHSEQEYVLLMERYMYVRYLVSLHFHPRMLRSHTSQNVSNAGKITASSGTFL